MIDINNTALFRETLEKITAYEGNNSDEVSKILDKTTKRSSELHQQKMAMFKVLCGTIAITGKVPSLLPTGTGESNFDIALKESIQDYFKQKNITPKDIGLSTEASALFTLDA